MVPLNASIVVKVLTATAPRVISTTPTLRIASLTSVMHVFVEKKVAQTHKQVALVTVRKLPFLTQKQKLVRTHVEVELVQVMLHVLQD